VERFECEFAKFLNVPHVVAVANGTVALHLALHALDIGRGDEVLVPDLTYVATANAVAYTGATPVLVDVDLQTWNIDLRLARGKITERTRAILPVHLYGIPCDMAAVRDLANDYSLAVVEDAAEGLGGQYGCHSLGTLGDAGCFSFYGNKVVTTGEGGAVVTTNRDLAAFLRHYRGQAMTSIRYFHDAIGFNYRLTDLQAAIGLAQLQRVQDLLEKRRRVIQRYRTVLGMPHPDPTWAPWLFTFLLPADVDRTRLADFLGCAGIETRPTFVPLHQMPMYRGLDQHFPHACVIGDRGISLPTFPELPAAAIDHICALLAKGLDHARIR
jgi:perosamine synthetase